MYRGNFASASYFFFSEKEEVSKKKSNSQELWIITFYQFPNSCLATISRAARRLKIHSLHKNKSVLKKWNFFSLSF